SSRAAASGSPASDAAAATKSATANPGRARLHRMFFLLQGNAERWSAVPCSLSRFALKVSFCFANQVAKLTKGWVRFSVCQIIWRHPGLTKYYKGRAPIHLAGALAP